MTRREELETLAAMHLEVAAYVEKLSGPDREVDAKIAAVMSGGWLRESVEVPAYTGSLDAAMRLVPEGLTGRMAWCAGARTVTLMDAEQREAADGTAATPALALCTAALRARASALTGYGEKG